MWVTIGIVSKFFYLLGNAAVVGGLPSYILLQDFSRQLLMKVFAIHGSRSVGWCYSLRMLFPGSGWCNQ